MASEAGHWYTRGTLTKWGKACYEVPRKDGKGMRATTLRDARELLLVPSVTAITGQLTDLRSWWGEQVVMSALTLPEIEGETPDDRKKRILKDAGEQAEKAREEGKRIHGVLERACQGERVAEADEAMVKAVFAEVETWCPVRECYAETVCTHHAIGYGGKADLHWYEPQKLRGSSKRRGGVVFDFKTKAFDEKKAQRPDKMVYPEYGMQLAAYGAALRMNPQDEDMKAINILISTSVPGLVCSYRWMDVNRWYRAFLGLYRTWTNVRGYYPKPVPDDMAKEEG